MIEIHISKMRENKGKKTVMKIRRDNAAIRLVNKI